METVINKVEVQSVNLCGRLRPHCVVSMSLTVTDHQMDQMLYKLWESMGDTKFNDALAGEGFKLCKI